EVSRGVLAREGRLGCLQPSDHVLLGGQNSLPLLVGLSDELRFGLRLLGRWIRLVLVFGIRIGLRLGLLRDVKRVITRGWTRAGQSDQCGSREARPDSRRLTRHDGSSSTNDDDGQSLIRTVLGCRRYINLRSRGDPSKVRTLTLSVAGAWSRWPRVPV